MPYPGGEEAEFGGAQRTGGLRLRGHREADVGRPRRLVGESPRAKGSQLLVEAVLRLLHEVGDLEPLYERGSRAPGVPGPVIGEQEEETLAAAPARGDEV